MTSISTDSFFRNGGTATAKSTSKPNALPGSSDDAVVQAFLNEAKKSPVERLREAWLKAHNMSEEDLAKLPPDQRKAIEDDIRKSIQEAMTKQPKQQQKSFAETLAEVG
jgi:replicative superfamily II helicase